MTTDKREVSGNCANCGRGVVVEGQCTACRVKYCPVCDGIRGRGKANHAGPCNCCPVCGAKDSVEDGCCRQTDCYAVICAECGGTLNSICDPCTCEPGPPESSGKRTVLLFSLDGRSTISMVCSNGDKVIRLNVMGDALFYQDRAYHRYQTRRDVNLILIDHGAFARMGMAFDTSYLQQINELFEKLQPGVPICHLNLPE